MLILIGPSASGKTELAKYLVKNSNFEKIITYTTRNKRPNEVDGIDYHFLNEETFISLKNEGFFAETTLYNGSYYGTSLSSLQGNKVIILDPQGYLNLEKYPNIKKLSFFLKVDPKTRFERMIKRKNSNEEALERISIDESVFDEKKIKCDYIIDGNNKSIEELALYVEKIYKSTF